MIARISMIVFFAAYCVNYVFPHPVVAIVAAVAAGVAAVALIIEK